MSPGGLAKDLQSKLKAPSWAVSVSAWPSLGQLLLFVTVDPGYRLPLEVPTFYRGCPVRLRWRTQALSPQLRLPPTRPLKQLGNAIDLGFRNVQEHSREKIDMRDWVCCTAADSDEPIYVNLANAVSLYWNEDDRETVVAFAGRPEDALSIKEHPEQVLSKSISFPLQQAAE